MNGIALINIAWQSFLFTAIGWTVAHRAVRDARYRAWMVLATLILAVAGPIVLNLIHPIEFSSSSQVPLPTLRQPDWKVELTPAPADLRFTAIGGQTVESSQSNPPASKAYPIFLQMNALWMLGAAFMGLRHLGRSIRAFAWHQRLRRLTADEVGQLSSIPGVEMARAFVGPGSPCVSGVLRPVVAIPDSAFRTLSQPQWRAVFRHEMEHISGQDTRLIWCLEWMAVIFWWNPFFHGLVRQWSQAREEICDHTALQPEAEPSSYAELLLLVAGWSGPAPCRARMASHAPVGRLKSRIQAILHKVPVAPRPGRWFVLGYLLLSGGLLVAISGTGFAEAPDKHKASALTSLPSEDNDGLITVTYRIPSGFLPAQTGDSAADTVHRRTGMEFREGAKVEFIEGSMLFVRNTASQHKKFSKVLDSYIANIPTQIRFETKWVEIDTSEPTAKEAVAVIDKGLATGVDGGITLTQPQMEDALQQLSQKKGVHLLSAPKVTTKNNQRATVEVIREFKVPTIDSTPEEAHFVGVRSEVEAILENDRLRISVTGEIRTVSGLPIFEAIQRVNNGQLAEGSTVIALNRSVTTTIGNGETIALPMGTIGDSRRVYLFVTASVLVAGAVVEIPASSNDGGKATAAPRLHRSAELTVRTLALPLDKSFAPLDQLLHQPGGTSDKSPSNDDHVLAGLFTATQLETLLRDIKNHTASGELKESKGTVTPLQPKRQFAALKTGERPLEVTASAGTDGQTLDLVLRLPAAEGKQSPTTSVTLWDGQTILFGRMAGATDQRKLTEAIFITANLIK